MESGNENTVFRISLDISQATATRVNADGEVEGEAVPLSSIPAEEKRKWVLVSVSRPDGRIIRF